MPTDEHPSVPPAPPSLREWVVATVRSRLPWSVAPPQHTWRWPVVRALAALAGVGVVVAAWLVLRPTARPDIATLLPRAGEVDASGSTAPATASGTTGVASTPLGGGATGASGTTGVLVHVVGAVVAPGVVRVSAGARVLDAVAAAGGTTPDADLVRVNLAAKLTDGQRVAVPRVGESLPAAVDGGGGAADAGGAVAGPIDLNTATAAELDALPGVGPSTAAAIVAHRTQHGPFRSVDALGDVKGIGPAKLEQLRPLVAV